MCCSCGNHGHEKRKTKDEIIKEFKNNGFDIVAEYELIKQKKSNLSANDRRTIVMLMEMENE